MILLQTSTPYLIDHVLTYVQNQIESNAALSVSRLARERIASVLTVTRNLVSLLHRCHLALFYINGIFYHVAKRILSIHYVRIVFGLIPKLAESNVCQRQSYFLL